MTLDTIRIERGTDWSAVITFKDGAGAGIILTGGTVTSEMVHPNGTIPVTVTAITPASGVYRMSLDETGTGLLPAGAVTRWRATWVTAGGQTSKATLAQIEGL